MKTFQVKTKRGTFELLNCDDHRNLAGKIKKDPATLRPDILHQELLALLDSPLNKAGKLKVGKICFLAPQPLLPLSIFKSVRVKTIMQPL